MPPFISCSCSRAERASTGWSLRDRAARNRRDPLDLRDHCGRFQHMIKSMTGFASVTREDDRATMTVTIRALNHRYLDLQLRMPQSLAGLEAEIRSLVSKRVTRG